MKTQQQLQTPKKETNRRSKPLSDLKKPPKVMIVKKCLDDDLESAWKDDLTVDLLQDWPLDEISEIIEGSDESFVTMDPLLPLSPNESIGSSDLTPSSAITTVNHVVGDTSATPMKSLEPENSSDKPFIFAGETDIYLSSLRKAQTQLTNSTDLDFHSKTLVEKLIQVVVDDISGLPDVDDRYGKLFAMKFEALMLSSLVVFLSIVVYVFSCGEKSSYRGPLPT